MTIDVTDVSARLTAMRWWDLPAVMTLERALFGPECWTEELFWSELAQPESRHYLSAYDATSTLGAPDVLVGYGGLACYADEAFVQTLAVAPDAQRHGVGTMLLRALLAEAQRRGLHRVGLEVRADNDAAQRLYVRHGFDVVGRRRGYYQHSGVDAIVMLRAGA